jgi:dihydroorotate dehydrogenase (NAD+) catalytic subunit
MSSTVRSTTSDAMAMEVVGLRFQNPIVLAAGTAGYGRELARVMDLDALGGLVTKAVSPEPRAGAAAPRVAEFEGGMINAVGLANPGLEEVRREHLPWLASHVRRARVIVNVVGRAVEDYAIVVAGLQESAAAEAFELNVSCPNVKAGGMEFGADPCALAEVVRGARAETSRPLFVKLSPTLPDVAASARIAVDAGADAITLVNTIPGLVIDVERRRPALGFGGGGVSGAALLPVGVLATWKVSRAVKVPIMGIGGVSRAEHAVQYLMAGASLVGMGTAAMQDPRLPGRIVSELDAWRRRHGVGSLTEVVGALEWPK